MIVFIIILMVTTLIPRTGSAGVVIEQTVTSGAPADRSSVTSRTLMVQDDKEKVVINDRRSIIIDAETGKVTALDSQDKIFRQVPLRVIIGRIPDPNRFLYMTFKSTDNTRKLLGFRCRDYTSTVYSGPLMRATTACFSDNASGSTDFTHFLRSVLQRFGRRAAGVSIPAGIPLVVESTHSTNPSYTPPDVPDKEALRFKTSIAKIRPQVIRVEVTKVTSQKLAPDVFAIPANYTRRGPEPD